MIRNPKQEGSIIFDCIPQTGPCPMGCSQCFYNRPNAFYVPVDQPNIPEPAEVADGIVRMNCGHDSNIQRNLVIETAKQYKHFFFNTSIARFDFPGPVVFTANPKEEENPILPTTTDNMMFVRLRVSATNLHHIQKAVRQWTELQIPVVLTFMAYYDIQPDSDFYEYKVRHINSYWCAKKEFIQDVLSRMKQIGGRLVTMCGTLESPYCKDCRNCETYYWQTIKHLCEHQPCCGG